MSFRCDFDELGGDAIDDLGGGGGGGSGSVGTLIDVRDYGASLSSSQLPQDRAAYFQLAIDAAAAQNPPAGVYIPQGVWQVGRQGVSASTSSVKPAIKLKAGVRVVGDGPGVTVIKLAAADYTSGGDYYMVQIQAGNDNCGLKDLTLHGNRYNISGDEQTHLVRCEGVHGVTFDNVEFLDSYGDGLKGLGEATTLTAASKVWQYDESANTYVDLTSDFNDAGTADVSPFPASEAVNDCFIIGYSSKFNRLEFNNASGTAGTNGRAVWEYYNGTSWVSLDGIGDATAAPGADSNAFTATRADALAVAWKMPTDWATVTLNNSGGALYYVRARVTQVYTVNPVLDRGYIASAVQCSFRATNCLFKGIRRGGLTWQRSQSYCMVLGCRFEDIRGQYLDFEPSGSVTGNEPIHNVIANCIFDNTRNTGAGYKCVTIEGIASPDNTVKTIFANNQLINGSLWMSRVTDVVVANCYIYGNTAYPAVELVAGCVKVTITGCHVINRCASGDPDAIKMESSTNTARCEDVLIEGCILESPLIGVSIHTAKNCTIRNTHLLKTGASGGSIGVSARAVDTDTDGLQISGCFFDGWEAGVQINNNAQVQTGLIVVHNHFDGCTTDIVTLNQALTGLPVLGPNDHGTTPYSFVGSQYYRIGAVYYGPGTPESNVTAGPGNLYADVTNGEAYVKDSGTGNTNWKAITHA